MPEPRNFERRSEPVGSCPVCGAPIFAGCEHIKNLNQTIEPIKEKGGEVKYIGGYREPPPDAKLQEELGKSIGIYKVERPGKHKKIFEEFDLYPIKHLIEKNKIEAGSEIEEIEKTIPTLRQPENRQIFSLILKEWHEKDDLRNALQERKANQVTVLEALLSDIELTVRARKGIIDPEETKEIIRNAFEKIEKRYGLYIH